MGLLEKKFTLYTEKQVIVILLFACSLSEEAKTPPDPPDHILYYMKIGNSINSTQPTILQKEFYLIFLSLA